MRLTEEFQTERIALIEINDVLTFFFLLQVGTPESLEILS